MLYYSTSNPSHAYTLSHKCTPPNRDFESPCALFLYIRVAVRQTKISVLSCSRQWPEILSFHTELLSDIYEKIIQLKHLQFFI